MGTQKLILVAVAGLVAGAVAGLLSAPLSGSDTRRKIAVTTGKIKSRLSRLVGKATNELDELKDIVQNQADGLSEDVRHRLLKVIAASKESYKNIAAEATA
jgi:gas vesicle protein